MSALFPTDTATMTNAPDADRALRSALQLFTPTELARGLGVSDRTVRRWTRRHPAIPAHWSAAIGRLMRDWTANAPAGTGAFRFIDLFAGIGGLRRGFEDAGGHCVFSSEWDRFALQTYRANFGNEDEEIHADLREITAASEDTATNSRNIRARIPEHDVLLAGFPCQPFSLAGVSKKNSLGRRHGFMCEAQGTLFFDVARILEVRRPRAFLLENVKNLRSHDGGRTYEVIRRVLEEDLGYRVYDRVIDAKGFVPQHRERIYMVGFREDAPFSWDQLSFPEPTARTLGEILHPEDGSEAPERHYTIGEKAEVADRYTLSAHLWQYLQDYRKKHAAAGNGFGFSRVGPGDTTRTLSARYHKDGSEILVDRGEGQRPRRLTPRECARLMGFDDDFVIPVSDTQAYRQFGNSVAVPVIREIARVMIPQVLAQMQADRNAPQLRLPMESAPA
jgi:DNA (cytosine-5)-methyltransferase 1